MPATNTVPLVPTPGGSPLTARLGVRRSPAQRLAALVDRLSKNEYLDFLDTARRLEGWMAYAEKGEPPEGVDASDTLVRFADFECVELTVRGGLCVAAVWRGREGWHVTSKSAPEPFLCHAATLPEALMLAEQEALAQGYFWPAVSLSAPHALSDPE